MRQHLCAGGQRLVRLRYVAGLRYLVCGSLVRPNFFRLGGVNRCAAPSDASYALATGTSMAAPHVAGGVAALTSARAI